MINRRDFLGGTGLAIVAGMAPVDLLRAERLSSYYPPSLTGLRGSHPGSFEAAHALLVREATGTAFRLIGIGGSPLLPIGEADRGDLADIETPRRAAAQAAIDALRQRFGEAAIGRGRGWVAVGGASPPPARLPQGEGE